MIGLIALLLALAIIAPAARADDLDIMVDETVSVETRAEAQARLMSVEFRSIIARLSSLISRHSLKSKARSGMDSPCDTPEKLTERERIGCQLKQLLLHHMETLKTGQTFTHRGEVISDADPFWGVLDAYRAAIQMGYDERKRKRARFTPWVHLHTPSAERLFPNLRFAFISWSETAHPEAKERPSDMIHERERIVALDKTSGQITMEFHTSSPYDLYGKLLLDYGACLGDAAEAKTIWDAFCEIHHPHWKWMNYPSRRISDTEWHLGLNSYDSTTSVVSDVKTVQTNTHYMKVVVDPATRRIVSWESQMDTSNVRKIPAIR